MVQKGSLKCRGCDAQSRPQRGAGREHGAATLIVVLGMVAMMGAAAFAIDLGAAWALRRDLITGTDAAALAAATEFALGNDGCDLTDDEYLGYNAPNATLVDCTWHPTGGGFGWVEVAATQQTPSYFGSVLGLADIDVPSFSAAGLGQVLDGSGLRPFGLCAGVVPSGSPPPWLVQLNAYLANPAPMTIQITYGKDAQTDPCGDPTPSNGSGNWGTLDLDDPVICPPAWDPGHPCNGNPNPNPDLAKWTKDGFERPIQRGTPGQDCIQDAEHCWDGDVGNDMNSGPVRNALDSLIANQTWFILPLFDSAKGNGGNTQFHIFEFARVRVKNYCFSNCSPTTPPPASCTGPQCSYYLELEFAPGPVSGTCCDSSATTLSAFVAYLCAVDPTDTANC